MEKLKQDDLGRLFISPEDCEKDDKRAAILFSAIKTFLEFKDMSIISIILCLEDEEERKRQITNIAELSSKFEKIKSILWATDKGHGVKMSLLTENIAAAIDRFTPAEEEEEEEQDEKKIRVKSEGEESALKKRKLAKEESPRIRRLRIFCENVISGANRSKRGLINSGGETISEICPTVDRNATIVLAQIGNSMRNASVEDIILSNLDDKITKEFYSLFETIVARNLQKEGSLSSVRSAPNPVYIRIQKEINNLIYILRRYHFQSGSSNKEKGGTFTKSF